VEEVVRQLASGADVTVHPEPRMLLETFPELFFPGKFDQKDPATKI
jgi:hypothetical protein